jgi:hypothetical protein
MITAAAEPAIIAALLGLMPTVKPVTKGVANKNAIAPVLRFNFMVNVLKFEKF